MKLHVYRPRQRRLEGCFNLFRLCLPLCLACLRNPAGHVGRRSAQPKSGHLIQARVTRPARHRDANGNIFRRAKTLVRLTSLLLSPCHPLPSSSFLPLFRTGPTHRLGLHFLLLPLLAHSRQDTRLVSILYPFQYLLLPHPSLGFRIELHILLLEEIYFLSPLLTPPTTNKILNTKQAVEIHPTYFLHCGYILQDQDTPVIRRSPTVSWRPISMPSLDPTPRIRLFLGPPPPPGSQTSSTSWPIS